MRTFLYSFMMVLLIANGRGEISSKNVIFSGKKSTEPAESRFFTSSNTGSSNTGTNLFTNSALELSFGAFNSLFGSSNSDSTISIGNLSYLTLGALILVPLIIGLALVFYLVGGSGAVATALRRTDAEFTARNYIEYNPYRIDWEKFSILDWISVAEETWRKFDPANFECQKRLICELHQNTVKFGFVARKLVDAFSYLEYAEVLRLPEEVKAMIEDYLDAADRGRSLKKDCGEIYSACDFSVKNLVERVTDNEI